VSGILWPVEDGQGNVRDILGSAGTILDHRVLDTFGNILSQSGSSIDFDHFQSGMFWGGEKGVRNEWHCRERKLFQVQCLRNSARRM